MAALKRQTNAATTKCAVLDRLAAQQLTYVGVQARVVVAQPYVHSIKYAVVLLVKHVLTLLSKSVATTNHALRESAVMMVHVQICLGSCVVGCQSVLGVNAVVKILQQGVVRMVRCAVGVPILLFVVKLENGVRVGNVLQAMSFELYWWCNLYERGRRYSHADFN